VGIHERRRVRISFPIKRSCGCFWKLHPELSDVIGGEGPEGQKPNTTNEEKGFSEQV
jgi:hypothetical protein